MHCQLLVPGFGWPRGDASELCDALASDALQTLFARGRRTRVATVPDMGAVRWLLERFGVARQRDWPAAPFSLLAEGGSPGDSAWICADPVHLRFERNRLVLLDSTQFAIARDEAEVFAVSINGHFGGGLVIYPLQAHRWYARLTDCPDMETTPLASVRGGEIEAALPHGPDAIGWQARINEMQMLLHDHPVNLAREARDELAVNSVWLWGAGRLAPIPERPFRYVTASDPLALGLAQASGALARELAANARLWLADMAGTGHTGIGLAVLDSLAAPSQYGEEAAWREALSKLERDWFAPLLAALRQGSIGMLTVYLLGPAHALQVEVVRSDLRRFWRRRQPLAGWLA